jgi:hypothetical protein
LDRGCFGAFGVFLRQMVHTAWSGNRETQDGAAMSLYSHYDGAHNHPLNRALHMIAIPVGFSSLIVVWFHPVIAVLLIPAAFAMAWIGHLIEGNKPAFLTNPVHVLVAPLWMARRVFRFGERLVRERGSGGDRGKSAAA